MRASGGLGTDRHDSPGDALPGVPARARFDVMACRLRSGFDREPHRARFECILIGFLSVRPGSTHEEVAQAVFSNCNGAGVSLRMVLRRFRKEVDRSYVRCESGRYRLTDDPLAELRFVERTMRSIARGSRVDTRCLAMLRDCLARLQSRPALMGRYEWFEPTEWRLRRLESEIASALAARAG